ncbi:MAG: thioredoxin-dependent thiol peroxidase [Candidatus Melainabacteria bacterium HGW-Melainabacteria-1]|nr:MAG: thioredoxin-dependent thiol peroxidase [Candidatus Melainabacteria bacterium HGW-Melainabacteria-1]
MPLNFPPLNQAAPPFSLQDQDGNTLSPAEFTGKQRVLVYFYPKAMTPGCNVQARGLRDSQQALTDHQVKVLGISPDPVSRLKKFQAKEGLNFSLLSDPEHVVADAYGVWGLKKFMGREFDGIHRISFLIGLDGKLEHIFQKFKTATHHQDVLNWLQNNKMV